VGTIVNITSSGAWTSSLQIQHQVELGHKLANSTSMGAQKNRKQT